ncbi:MAG TPA: 16S rRNA (cytosine(967)-C(5))-methyltransferase RsmB [Terriglobia bacterium]|nr:16S rRNA (cytosine(967)-C(5))-methyltransferase RsmB [Terriglobia bacterium]
MQVSPARNLAYRILRRVHSGHRFAIDFLQSPPAYRLKEVDRRLATGLVMGALRWRGDLDFEIQRLSGKPLEYFDPEIVEILRLGIYQIRFLSSIPKAAAVNESVELVKAVRKRSASGLVNAVLRKCQHAPFDVRNLSSGSCEVECFESACRSIPQWIRERWEKSFGAEQAKALILATQSVPPLHLRVTGNRFDRRQVQSRLGEEGVQAQAGALGSRSLRVEKGDLFRTAVWREGRVAIQDEGSQLVAQLLRPAPGDCVLDLCAAPGIKTSLVADDLNTGILAACDISLHRMKTLGKLLPHGLPPGIRLHKILLDAAQPLPFARKFDRILVDVPCSGTGTLARNPEIKWRLRPEDILRLAALQENILRQGLQSLAPGGRLVYSTCSLEPEENEGVVSHVLEKRPEFRTLTTEELAREFPRMASLFDGYFRTKPGIHGTDGFFATVITRLWGC